MARANLLAVVVFLLLATAGCGASDNQDGPTFPVRLLPPAPPLGFVSLIDPEFDAPDALAPWRMLEIDDAGKPAKVVPAAGHPRVSVVGDDLLLQPGTGVLFRYVEVPAEMFTLIRVRLTADSGSAVGDCPSIRGPLLARLEDGFTPLPLGDLRAAAPNDLEARKSFYGLANRIRAFDNPVTGFTWGDPVPDGSPRLAEARFKTKQSPELRAICLRNTSEVLRVDSIGLGQAPALRRNDIGGQDQLPPSSGSRLLPRQASFAGELRPAIRIDAGTAVTFMADLPPGATRLTFGVAHPLHTKPATEGAPDELRWTVELAGAPGSFDNEWVTNHALSVRVGASLPPKPAKDDATQSDDSARVVDHLRLGAGTTHGSDRPVRWRDVSLDWPPGSPGGATQLVLTVTGHGQLLLAQPVLHGPVAGKRESSDLEPIAPGDPTRPNLLLLSIDTLRADHTGWHGYARPTTPSLDALAAGATVFDRCMSVGPYTLPSHATLLSGLFPIRHGARRTTDRVGENVPTLATLLASRGWATAAFTGGGFLSPDYGFSTGFDRYQSVDPIHNPEATGGLGRFSVENLDHEDELNALHSLDSVDHWIRDNADGPWFAFVHTYVAHEYRPPAADLALFDTQPESDWGRDVQERLTPRAWVSAPPTDADIEHLVNLYDASIRFVDREIGALLERLDRQDLLENTVIVLTSDHGEEFLEHGHLRHSQSLYEEMLHVPLVIRVPRQQTGTRVPEHVHLADITPTVLSVLGVPLPSDLDGISRHDLLPGADAGPSATHAPTEMYATVETDWSRRASVRIGDIKLIRGDTAKDLTYPSSAEWELYDLAADPLETDNRYEQMTRKAALLQNRLDSLEAAQHERAQPSEQAEVSQDLKDQLKALGYVDEG